MAEIKKVLFPVDLSESSDRLAPTVRSFIDIFHAETHLFFAARVFGYFSTIYVNPEMISEMEDSVVKGGKKKMEEFKSAFFENVPNVITSVMLGNAGEEILNYVEKQNIDLIIMGTHGRKGLDKILFGSVADQIVKNSPVPVLVINPFKTPVEK